MSRLIEWFRERLLGASQETPSRLDRERVLAIARAAAAPDPEAAKLSMTVLQNRAGAKIWVVRPSAVGNVLVVEIDDATEAVLSVRRYGSR
ncbi:MAG TPA: hypothetical protein VHG72_23055 [Polyangia bacterium]|nr:hypothetical protein [Polyangia bacterium]